MRILILDDFRRMSAALMRRLASLAPVIVADRARTLDEAASHAIKFVDAEEITARAKRRTLPDGSLMWEGVPIARVGVQEYAWFETPIKPKPGDIRVRIHRTADEVFRPETIASFNGAPLVNDHPPEDVTPDNWKQLVCGIVLNPRRGTGDDGDFLLADVRVIDRQIVADIDAGKRELSCGYDADYLMIKPGEGRQTNIVGNHVALVKRGRCGMRCAIGDHSACHPEHTPESPMKPGEKSIFQKIRDAIAGGNTAEVQTLVTEAEKVAVAAPTVDADTEPSWFSKFREGLDARLKPLETSVADITTARTADAERVQQEQTQREQAAQIERQQLEQNLAAEAPEGKGGEAGKARDSVLLMDSCQETIALGEIIVPGIKFPTFDRAADPKTTFDALCGFRRDVLEQAYAAQEQTRAMIDLTLQGKAFKVKDLGCGDVRSLFRATAAFRKAANAVVPKPATTTTKDTKSKPPQSLADLNKRNAEHWQKQATSH